jgi:CBS domain-containing protein
MPSGPTVVDEIANAAFWYGLLAGLSRLYPDIRRVMEFDAAHENFVAAARLGLRAQFAWPGHHHVPADELILNELLPIAKEGLLHREIDEGDVERYLGILEERVRTKRTGAQWQLESFAFLRDRGTKAERLAAITAAAVENQQGGLPVARWPVATLEHAGGWERHLDRVEQFMTTDLFTVGPDEAIELVANLMTWKKIRHVPVEDAEHTLLGIVSQRTLTRLVAERVADLGKGTIAVRDVMATQLVTVTPETPTLDAIDLMKKHKVGSLPVLKEGRLVGIVTESDFLTVSAQLLEEQLKRSARPAD